MVIGPNCHLIAVVGGKGGVGKSVFAANFAAALMLELRTQVLLIDADGKSAGDQNVILGLRPVKTISEIAQYQGSLTPQNIPQLVTTHPSGLAFIGAVRGPEETLNASADAFLKPLEFFSRHFKYIVVDVGNELKEFQMAMLQQATAITIVTNPEVLVINQTQRLIGDLLTQTFPLDMFQLVLNKVSPGSLSPQAISQSLKLPVVGMIPQDDVTTSGSVQRGTPFVLSQNKTPVASAYHDVVRKITGGPLQRLKALNKPQAPAPSAGGVSDAQSSHAPGMGIDARTNLKIRVHNELIRAIDPQKRLTETNNDPAKEKALREKTMQSITQIVDRESPGLAREERSKIIKEVLEEALGLGPLEDLLADPTVTEIMVNGHRRIFVERSGLIQLSGATFTSNDHLRKVIERIVMPLGRQINQSQPYVDARLKDGSRVNAIIEPLAIDGPSITIRKFKKGGISPDRYVDYGSMTKPMIDLLKMCVENGLNVVISGGTGSGKTSLLNMLSGFIPSHERIITVEDAAELQMNQEHVVRLESRPAGMDGSGAVTIRDLVRNALRMRPDRIVVGECRDGAALDMLSAMNTGHDGSMTTTHANNPRECLSRLETLCMMAGMDLPVDAIRKQVASAVDLIVQVNRLSDGTRKITSITEVTGMQGDIVTLQDIFEFKETGRINGKIQGHFTVRMVPSFLDDFKKRGISIPESIFAREPENKDAAKVQAQPNKVIANPMANLKKTGTGGKT